MNTEAQYNIKIFGINNRKGMGLKIKQLKNPTLHRSQTSRGNFRTLMRSQKIDDIFITPTVHMNTYNFHDSKHNKPKVY